MPLSSEELSRAMERLDTNGDGTLQQEEFVTWYVGPTQSHDMLKGTKSYVLTTPLLSVSAKGEKMERDV